MKELKIKLDNIIELEPGEEVISEEKLKLEQEVKPVSKGGKKEKNR